jgi:hypothetical protein
MSRLLIVTGLLLVGAGVLWPWIGRLGLGRLPGDIAIKSAHGSFYFPVVTCLVISAVISLVFWLFGR